MVQAKLKCMRNMVDELESARFGICSRWAAKYRIMQGGKPYSLSRFPYVREIMDSGSRYNWIKKGAQTGLTETAISIALFTTVRMLRDVIYYFPTKAKMTEISCSRIDDGIILSPFLTDRCTMKNANLKRFGASSIFMLGANSDTDLKSTAAGRLIMDEFDEWKSRAVYLAMERTSGQVDKDVRVWGFSTPKLPDCGIDAKWEESTKEYYFFQCPHCDQWIDLTWSEEHPEFHCFVIDDCAADAYYRCWRCGRELPHDSKPKWLSNGAYYAKDDDNNPVEPDTELRELSRGFYVPQMLSPGVTPQEFGEKYLRGASGDLDALREFHNSAVGAPWIEDSHRVTESHLRHAKTLEKFSMSNIGTDQLRGSTVTLGIDQGGPVHHWSAVEWTFDLKKYGDPNDKAVGKMVGCGRIMADEWDRIYGLMREFQVRMAVIDYFPQPTDARMFARRFPEFVYLCQYTTGNTGREIRTTEDDYGANLVKVDKVAWLSKSLGRIISGDLAIPIDTPQEFSDHVRALVRTMDKDTIKAVYAKSGPDHYAHTLVYAEIALKILDPVLGSENIRMKG